ncbi:MAG TPA: RodZ domain-containing protein [Acidimicrobiales bacterium]|nr:RodZ domain-containing protein [Acidimicrobiales bacterium]
MIALVLVALVVVVGAFALASRFVGWRSEQRSVDSYERALDVLGGMSRRSEASAPVHLPSDEEVARPHVRPAEERDRFRPARSALRDVPAARVRLEPPVPPRTSERGLPVFGDEETVVLEPPVPPRTSERGLPVFGEEASAVPASAAGPLGPPHDGRRRREAHEEAPRLDETEALPVVAATGSEPGDAPSVRPRSERRRGTSRPLREHVVRRASTGAAAAVALAALAVGAWQLASRSASSPPAPPSTTTPAASGSHPRSPTPTTSVTNPNVVEPLSVSSSLVTAAAPAGSYTLGFTTSGVCWVGVERTTSGPYLWMETIPAGGSASFQANGPVVVRIGAPRVLHLAVDGKPVALPAGNVQPYDLSFVAGSSSTSA